MGIAVSGTNVAPPAAIFSDIAFPSDAIREAVLGNIEDLEFSEPTAVQVLHTVASLDSVIILKSMLCMVVLARCEGRVYACGVPAVVGVASPVCALVLRRGAEGVYYWCLGSGML